MNDADWPQAPESSDEALDALLRQAAWPEPDSAAVERLRGQWRSLIAERRGWRFRQWGSAAAAAVVVLGLGVWLLWPRSPQDEVAVGPDTVRPERNAPLAPREEPAARPGPDVVAESPDDAPPQLPDRPGNENGEFVWSRPATAYQQLVVARMEYRRRTRTAADERSTDPAQPQPMVDVLESAIQELLADPGANVAMLAEPLLRDRTRHEGRLLERLPRALIEEQLANIALLARLGSPRSVPALLQLSRKEQLHAAALRAAAPHADPILLGEVARRESDPALQRELLRELASRPQPQALAVCLELIADPATREPALAALEGVPQPPVELLFGYLNEADSSQQLAAALVLGRLDGPEITQRLIRQALSNIHRQPALLALLANPSDEARRFVRLAERDQSLFAAVYSARLQFQLLHPLQRGVSS